MFADTMKTRFILSTTMTRMVNLAAGKLLSQPDRNVYESVISPSVVSRFSRFGGYLTRKSYGLTFRPRPIRASRPRARTGV
jgi:hypothetical protein